MNDFIRKVVEGNGVSPSDVCLQSFNQNFGDAVHVEWFRRENNFEAVFYKNRLEYIAIFSLTGFLIEYRINIPEHHLPVHIKEIASSMGEIMNAVMRNKGNKLEYEVIVRDKELRRTQITLSDAGKTINEKRL